MSLTCGHHTTLREGIDPVPMLEANCLLLCGPREPQAALGERAGWPRRRPPSRRGDVSSPPLPREEVSNRKDFPLQADVRCDGEVQARARRPARGSGRRAQAVAQRRPSASLLRFEPTVWRRVESAGTHT